jgi:Tfp pilus assembly pilus retraction ATPase PilT
MGTLHTGSAIRTIDRVIGAFPPEQQPQVRMMFSESLRAIVSQRLVKRADGQGRVPALEVLHGTSAVSNLIREKKTFQLRSILQTGRCGRHEPARQFARAARARRRGDARRGAAPRRRPEDDSGGERATAMARLHELLKTTARARRLGPPPGGRHGAAHASPRRPRRSSNETPLAPTSSRPAARGGERGAVAGVRPPRGDLDFALPVPGVARFRANYLRQERGPSAIFRTIPETIASLEELNCRRCSDSWPSCAAAWCWSPAPPARASRRRWRRSSTASTARATCHIVTIEEPVEFVHQNQRSVFSQREVGTDTDSFASALRAAIREDADVVLVGEMRDLETIALALRAAEMGLLVFGTLHTNSAAKTIDRLIDVFPAEEQAQTRVSLAESLVAIVAQLLVPKADGGAASRSTRSCCAPPASATSSARATCRC